MLLAPAFAQARSSSLYAYPESSIWNSVVRLVRVDFESVIVEKDRDAGYLLFNYNYSGKVYSGSVEVVPTVEKGAARVKVQIQIAGMPSYVERMMLDRLEKKLTRDFGQPLLETRPAARRGASDEAGDEGGGDAEASESRSDEGDKSRKADQDARPPADSR